ncbi:hypothetical protein E0J18_12020 [Rhizobium leguminosarum bv. viciae]|nr:hypothetical protein E0J18_12020 [Rhizobium leguminosarum bv. viciae]
MTQAIGLVGTKLKVDRAKRHLNEYNAILKAFIERDPYQITYELDPLSGELVMAARVREGLPAELSTVIGDVVHNLRSALDQMVCALVRSNGQKVTRAHSFPIAEAAQKFAKLASVRLEHVPQKARRFIYLLRPYQGGNRLFWLLSELDNMDKHDDIIPVAEGSAQTQLKIGSPAMFITPDGGLGLGGGPPGSVPFGHHWGWVIPDDAKRVELTSGYQELYRVSPKLAGFNIDYQMGVRITLGAARAAQGEVASQLLNELIKLVERVVSIVERRFF